MGARTGSGVKMDSGIRITGHKNIRLGNNVNIMHNSALYSHDGLLEIGDDVSINSNVQLGAADSGKIFIGNKVMIGPNVVIRASDHAHNVATTPIKDQGHTGGTIIIEDDVWISSNCVVLRDVRIGAHSIVAAGAVVTRDVEPYSITAGVPARLLKSRTSSTNNNS